MELVTVALGAPGAFPQETNPHVIVMIPGRGELEAPGSQGRAFPANQTCPGVDGTSGQRPRVGNDRYSALTCQARASRVLRVSVGLSSCRQPSAVSLLWELPQPKRAASRKVMFPFWNSPHLMTDLMQRHKWLPPQLQFRATLKVHLSPSQGPLWV